MRTIARLKASLKIWVVIYPALTLSLYLFGEPLSVLPLYLRTLVLTLAAVPSVVFGLWGGAIADAVDRRVLLLLTGSGIALSSLALWVTAATGIGNVWSVLVLFAAQSALLAINQPTRSAVIPRLIPAEQLPAANALNMTVVQAGAVAGPLLAAALVAVIGIRATLLAAVIPGLFAAAAISVTARHARTALSGGGGRRLVINLGRLRGHGLARTYLPAALFEAGNVATTLLILRATGLLSAGRSATAAATLAILIYAGHNVLAAIASLAGGAIVDRGRPRLVLGAAALIYTGAYAVFAVGSHGWPVLLAGFCLAGIGIGFAETAQSAMIAAALPDDLRGSGFGLLGLIQAGGDLASTLVVSLLWTAWSATLGFGYAAAWMAACMITIALTRRPRRPASERRAA